MFRNRLITTLVVLPLFVWTILVIPTLWLAVLLATLAGLSALEWARMSGVIAVSMQWLYALVLVAGMGAFWYLRFDRETLEQVLLVALIWWATVLAWLGIPGTLAAGGRVVISMKLLMGVLVLLPAWYALVYLHLNLAQGHYWVLYIFILVWLADSGAYVAGKAWGRRKLAPRISPGKTVEGALGALALSVPCGIIGAWLLDVPEQSRLWFVLLSIAVIPVSIVGDLLESLMKRQAGIKDSGSLLPGHGGLMDRIDSLTAAAPVFVAGLYWWVGL